MNKRILLPGLLLASATAVGAIFGASGIAGQKFLHDFGSVLHASISQAALPSDWSVSNGDPGQLSVTETAGGVAIGNLHAFSAEVKTNDKVTLDGLSFAFQNDGSTDAGYNAATGFYFSQGAGFGFAKPVFTIWHALYPGQSRVAVASSHDYNEAAVVRTSPSVDAPTGFGLAGNMVMNALPNDGFTIAFEHTSYSWWKVTLTEVFENSFWDANANYSKPEGSTYATVTTYLQNTDMPVDENGAAYLHVFGASDNGGAVKVTNFVNGNYKVVPEDDATPMEVADAKAEINEINATEFPASLADGIEAAKTKGLSDIDVATKPSVLNTIVNDTKAAVKALYAAYAGYDVDLTAQDPSANFYPCWGAELYGKRYDDRGAVTMKINTSFGLRGELIRQYDAANFSAILNLGAVKPETAFYMNFDTDAQSFPTSGTKFYHLEFYKVSDSSYLAVFGNNGKGHNESYAAWGTEASGTFQGRFINTFSGTMNIAMVTNYETNTSTLSINGVSLDFDSSVINLGVTPTAPLMSHVALGGMNIGEFQRVLLEKMEDADSKAYADGLADCVAAVQKTIADKKAEILATLPEAGLDDTTYPAYKSACEAATAAMEDNGGLTAYDYAYYGLATFAQAAVDEVRAPLVVYEGQLAAAKDEAKAAINAFDEANYRANEQSVLRTTKESYIAAIDACETIGEVATTKADALTALAAIKTDAQMTLDEAKAAAKSALAEYLDLDDYRAEQQAEINAILTQANIDIDGCATAEAINAKVAAVKVLLDAVKTDTQLTLAEAKVSGKQTIAQYKNPADYRSAEKTTIAEIITSGNTAIDACTSPAAVQTKVTEIKAQLDAVKTDAQYQAEELASAKTDAISQIENYLTDLSKYNDDGKGKIADAIAACKEQINAATSVEAVATALANGKTALDAIPVKSNGCGGSIIGTSSAVAALALACVVLLLKKKHDSEKD